MSGKRTQSRRTNNRRISGDDSRNNSGPSADFLAEARRPASSPPPGRRGPGETAWGLVAKGVPSGMPARSHPSGSSVHSLGRYKARSRNVVPCRLV